MIECSARDAVFSYFHQELGLRWSDDFRGVLYVPEHYEGQLTNPAHVAVAVGYDCFIGRTCCMHSVIPQPQALSRKIVRASFAYPFDVCGCMAVLALVDSPNARSLSLVQRLGFKEVCRIPHGGIEGDLVVMQMLRDECPWIRRTLH